MGAGVWCEMGSGCVYMAWSRALFYTGLAADDISECGQRGRPWWHRVRGRGDERVGKSVGEKAPLNFRGGNNEAIGGRGEARRCWLNVGEDRIPYTVEAWP